MYTSTHFFFKKTAEKIQSIFYDKVMNISVWITDAGRAYFIQNHRKRRNSKGSNNVN